jgi:hypothetical protein
VILLEKLASWPKKSINALASITSPCKWATAHEQNAMQTLANLLSIANGCLRASISKTYIETIHLQLPIRCSWNNCFVFFFRPRAAVKQAGAATGTSSERQSRFKKSTPLKMADESRCQSLMMTVTCWPAASSAAPWQQCY